MLTDENKTHGSTSISTIHIPSSIAIRNNETYYTLNRQPLLSNISMAIKFRGRATWDPLLIIFQILTIQLLSYTSLTLLIFIATTFSGYSPSTIFIFNHRMMRLGTAKMVILAHLTNSFVGAHLLKLFVERSKSCLDFSITHYIIHFVLVCYYSTSLPDTFIWYFVNVVSACIMCVSAEYLCRREEMKSIPILASV